MNKICVISNPEKDPSAHYYKEVAAYLRRFHCTIQDEIEADTDLIVVLGGDGSILRAARKAAPAGIPLLGINMGRIGYMTELEISELSMLEKLFSGDYSLESRMMLGVEIIRGATRIKHLHALNDAVVSNGVVSRIAHVELFCNSRRVGHYYADGLICATPTGSTAYSLSAGGPIIDPKMNCICVTPVSPHSLQARPMIFSADSTLEIYDNHQTRGDLYLTVDGNENVRLEDGDTVKITRSDITTQLVRIKKDGFYDVLNHKLREQ